MAEAVPGAAIQFLFHRVLSLATRRIGLGLGFEEELETLRETATTIQAVLADADSKKQSLAVQLWLKAVEAEAFKAENVLDEINYEILRRKVEDRSQRLSSGFRSRMASKIREIKTNLERISRDASEFGLVVRYEIESALPVPAPTSVPTDYFINSNVVGRVNDESKIVEMLLSPSDKVVSVIPIVGMAGLGKTTLAKSVYDCPEISRHFDKKIWVCVAEKFGIKELFEFILESLTGRKVELDHRDSIVRMIGQELGGKRYFLVFDDVWNDKEGLWNDFFTTLEGLNTTNGNWCLVTTRLEQVANNLSRHLRMNVGPYKLGMLADDDCWSIIKEKVIPGEEIPNELETIKKQILRRCGGLPLAATLFGSLLLLNRKEEWPSIVQKGLLDGGQDNVKQIFKVSFDHLSPAPVKKCFTYCSLFPQDTELDKDLLIELWMAEGFLQSDPNNERLTDDIGDKYFKILLQSSLLLEEGNKWTRYKMHHLVHGFAKSVLNDDRYLAWNSSQDIAEDIMKNSTSFSTVFLKGSTSDDTLSKCECLRVLKLSGKDVKVLPASFDKLIHLRFLDISNSGITSLPESLCKLYNLQTLRIKDGILQKGLPKQMSNLSSLIHLHYYDTNIEFQMPSKMGQLTRLQTLKFFNVGQEDGCGIEELGTLKYLKGSLEIRNLELVNGKEGAEGAKLLDKPILSGLKFLWSSGDRESDNRDKDVLEGLQPHPNLQGLEIMNFMGYQFPGWLINLPTLKELRFIDCKRCRELPAVGQLPSLESLELKGLENIKSIELSFYGISSGGGGDGQVVVTAGKFFPALKYLSLEDMENLVEWKGEDEVRSTIGGAEVDLFPVLKRLKIKRCSQLTSSPVHFPSIEELEIPCHCHVLLLKKIVSSATTLSSLILRGHKMTNSHDDEHIEFLHLVKRPCDDNLEEDVKCRLSLKGCDTVLFNEMLESLCHLPSLRHLELEYFPNLTSLACSTSLERLRLWNCVSLRELPQDLYKFQALRHLSIERCPGVTMLGGDGGHKSFMFTSLEQLNISNCEGLTSLPGEISCSSLRILRVHDCPNLVSFPFDLHQTPSLEILHLFNCPGLMIADMPKGFAFLTSLSELVIGPFSINETTEFDWSGLISSSSSTLRSLCFYGLAHVKLLPEQLQYLTSLIELRLHGFGMEALPDWIGNLASLQLLLLYFCEKLRYLPSTDAMRHLTKLTSLLVWGSPLLKKRCNPESSPDSEWPKISHIPKLEID